jgi:hypothetical protein|tara:strand:+ start:1455 stop:2054 length:600 start_codon:yes stop_codon:yes gene_type:complete
MAVSEKAVEFLGNSLSTGRPVPGQSLTNSPDNKYKWEQPAEFSNVKEASMYVFEILTVSDTTSNLLNSVASGVGIIDLASIVLYSGFLEGKWNPDVMTLLMEPTMYMIMALSEKAEIEYVLESGDEERPKEMSPSKQLSNINQGINEFDKLRKQSTQKVNAQAIPQEIRKMIEETELPSSLLDQVKSNTTPSLLNKEEK